MKLFVLILMLFFFLGASCKTLWHQLEGYTFEDYLVEYKKSYSSSEHPRRRSLFQEKMAKIRAHNSDPTQTWKMGVNQFTDMTQEEFEVRLGLNKAMLYTEKHPFGKFQEPRNIDLSALPKSVDWRTSGIISAVKDQGQCGSCWTFGTTETIESYYAKKHGVIQVLSEQQILDCTPNPEQCGGTGGCGGGTGALAMAQLIQLGGQTTEWIYPYISYFGQNFQCHFNSTTPPSAFLNSYVLLPSNQQAPMMQHLGTNGPLIVNVDASTWSSYESGVFNSCNQTNPDIDHIVQAVGYGTDTATGLDYWLIRNSWSPLWGEGGYIRLLRTNNPPCGIDLNPQDGNVCKNGPSTVKVCGTCGVIYQAAFPVMN